MALSNWDTLALDQNGKVLPGHWESPLGVGVEIYKNWVHIHDKKAWTKGGYSYTKPIIMSLNEGDIRYKDVEIIALRGPQNGVFVAAWTMIYGKKDQDNRLSGMIGCGVSGYAGNGRYVGVTKKALRWFMHEINKKEIDYMISYRSWKTPKRTKTPFRTHVYHIPEVFKEMDLLKGQRYNQGDAFFSVNLKTDLQASKAGKAKGTTFSKLLKKR